MIPNLFPRTRAVVMALALAALAACTAPAPSTADTPAADATAGLRADEVAAATPPAQPAPEAGTTPSPAPLKKRITGGPLPPERISDQPESPPEIKVDTSCRTDADCAVKDVGNCCGHYPACVNVDSPTDPKGVQARCAKQGMASVCGFPQISGCTCVKGSCQASGDGVEEAVR
jgi:hypothetical protein